jgi:hypothetical protein
MTRSYGRQRTQDLPRDRIAADAHDPATSGQIRAMIRQFVTDALPDLISAAVEKRIAEIAEQADLERMRGVVTTGKTNNEAPPDRRGYEAEPSWKTGDPIQSTADINAANQIRRSGDSVSLGPTRTLREINQRNAQYWKPPVTDLAELNRRNSYLPRRDD